MQDKDRLLSLRAVAIRLALFRRDNVTPNVWAVRDLVDSGHLNVIKLSERRTRISEADLSNYLNTAKDEKK